MRARQAGPTGQSHGHSEHLGRGKHGHHLRCRARGHHGRALPSRETLASINIANITAVNLALAVNAGTFGSVAYASANQLIGVSQS